MEEKISRRLVFDRILKNQEVIFLKISDSNQYFENYLNNDNSINDENSEIRPMYLTILTKTSIDYDNYNLVQEVSQDSEYYDKNYKPYLMYFAIDDKDEIKKIKRINRKSKSTWITAKYVKYNNNNDDEYIKGNLFLNFFVNSDNKCLKINSYKIDDTSLKRIKEVYDINFDKYNICEIDNKKLKINTIPKKIRVYNVGHGNINLISGKKSCILFDIGCHRGYANKWKSDQNYNEICNSIKNILPDSVVISHWDIDHFKGYGVLNKKVFDVPWMVPHINSSSSENIKRLLKHIKNKSKLCYLNVDKSLNFTLYDKKPIKIKLKNGNGKTENGITEKNRKGLYIDITKNENKYLLMGDTPYKCANINNKNLVDLLVAPHHGSNTVKSDFPHSRTKKSIAIVCEKDKNIKKCDTHMRNLYNQGFDVYFVSGNQYNSSKNTNYCKWFEYDILKDTYNWEY